MKLDRGTGSWNWVSAWLRSACGMLAILARALRCINVFGQIVMHFSLLSTLEPEQTFALCVYLSGKRTGSAPEKGVSPFCD